MSWTILAAWATSKPLRWALAALLAFGGYEYWKHHQRGIGAQNVIVKIEAKAETNAKQAEAVREDVAAGKRGKPDPHRVRP